MADALRQNGRHTPSLCRQKAMDASFFIQLAITTGAGIAVALRKGPDRVLQVALTYLGFPVLHTPKPFAGSASRRRAPVHSTPCPDALDRRRE